MSTEKEPSKQAQRIRYSKVGCKGGIMAEGAHLNRPVQGHTPGPWRVGKSAGYNIANGVFAKSGYHIAEVVDVDSGQAQANARLIAAAPDLLAACKAFEGFYDGASDSSTRGMSEAYGIARAAIRAAEGQ